jgi:hypothetical protein
MEQEVSLQCLERLKECPGARAARAAAVYSSNFELLSMAGDVGRQNVFVELVNPALCCGKRHFSFPFLMIALCSSGIGGGTGVPEILVTAPKRGGQASKQVPHLMHFS